MFCPLLDWISAGHVITQQNQILPQEIEVKLQTDSRIWGWCVNSLNYNRMSMGHSPTAQYGKSCSPWKREKTRGLSEVLHVRPKFNRVTGRTFLSVMTPAALDYTSTIRVGPTGWSRNIGLSELLNGSKWKESLISKKGKNPRTRIWIYLEILSSLFCFSSRRTFSSKNESRCVCWWPETEGELEGISVGNRRSASVGAAVHEQLRMD
jgi:hypothetical protein